MSVVVDPSVLFGLVLEDENSAYTQAVLDEIEVAGAHVPSLFWFEIRNVLIVSERRGKIEETLSARFLAALSKLTFSYDSLPPEGTVMHLARRYQLTAYDASYLELAMRLKLQLATLNNNLKQAAHHASVPLFETNA